MSATVQDADLTDHRERRFEVVATLVLAIAALATAWSSYQASLWDGIQSSDYSKASGLRVEAAQQHAEANELRLADLSVLEGYLEAATTGNDELADFYLQRVRAEARPAFDAWVALDPLTNPDAPASPFDMPEYQLAAADEAQRLTEQADETFATGEEANGYSDTFTLSTVLFASALFFAAISDRFSIRGARASLLVIATVAVLAGVAIALTQPVTTG